MKAVKPRNEQFETIQRLKDAYEADGNPMVSMDTKKKEYLGTFYRDGHLLRWKSYGLMITISRALPRG
jgi:hypothetical protein